MIINLVNEITENVVMINKETNHTVSMRYEGNVDCISVFYYEDGWEAYKDPIWLGEIYLDINYMIGRTEEVICDNLKKLLENIKGLRK